MNKELFKETLVDELTKKGLSVKVTVARRVNNVVPECIILDSDDEIVPSIKIDSLYEDYENGKSLIDIVNEAYDLLKTTAPFEMDTVKNPSEIIPQLINRKINAELLATVPHRIINEDMALIYRALVLETDNGTISYIIKNNEALALNMTEEDLYNRSLSELKANIFSMEDVVTSVVFGFDAEPANLDELKCCDESLMLVVGDLGSTYKATAILKPDIQAKLSRVYPNGYYVLPSSIHEVITLPKVDDKDDLKDLLNMVKDINGSDVVSDDEFLADGVYEIKDGRLVKAA